MTSPVWHPFTQHGLQEAIPSITRAEGAAIYTSCGRRIIDAISSWWVTTHGHCHPRIMAAIRHQTEQLDQIIFAGWTHEPAERLARKLLELIPSPLAYVFFSDSGSTSVEVSLKMALGYWLNRNKARHRIVVMEESYHGDTIGAMSVGARGVFNNAYAPLLFDVARIPFPHPQHEQASLDELDRLCRGSDKPAAFIVEPLILGAGGMKIYAPSILKAMREICTRHDVLFIADEVMTGWGRTGTLFACEQADVVPDILCLSKGLTGGALPLAVTIATPPIFDAHYSYDRSKQFFHSSSYTANPIACAAAIANLEIWRDEPLLGRIQRLAAHQERCLAQLSAVRNPRHLGTVTAFEVDDDQGDYLSSVGPRLLSHFRSRDILLRPLGNTVYVMPPYCISEQDLDLVYDAIGDSLQMLAR